MPTVSNVQQLIDAIHAANITPTTTVTISLNPGTYDLSSVDATVVRDARYQTPNRPASDYNGLPVIQGKIKLIGVDTNRANTIITRSGSNQYRLLCVKAGATLTLERLTLSKGDVGSRSIGGGAVFNLGTLTATNCAFGPNNIANYGGAIRNDEVATITNCDIFQNATSGTAPGGGVYNEGQSFTMRDSILRGNNASDGGAFLTWSYRTSATVSISNCTIDGNTATVGAGIAVYSGSATVRYCVIRNNKSDGSALYARNDGRITANYNSIYGNTFNIPNMPVAYAVLNENSSAVLNARFNYWGRPEGPQGRDVEPGGAVNGSVNTTDFLCYAGTGGRSGSGTTAQTKVRYHRELAAEYAIRQSRENFSAFPYGTTDLTVPVDGEVGGKFTTYNLPHEGALGTGSAIFVSEVLWTGGGLPMLNAVVGQNPCSNDLGNGDTGWRVCCEGGQSTNAWNSHQGLMQYYADIYQLPVLTADFNVSDSIIAQSAQTPPNPDLENFMDFSGNGRWKSGQAAAGRAFLYDAFKRSGPLERIDTGDYIFINQGSFGAHGFVIVGWGEAVEAPDGLNAQPGTNFSILRQYNVLEVPYVADFCYGYNGNLTGWLQDPRPRPFYASAARIDSSTIAALISAGRLGTYTLAEYEARVRGLFQPFVIGGGGLPVWRFFHLPSSPSQDEVLASRVYCPPCGRPFGSY